jgi:hypothetical protein
MNASYDLIALLERAGARPARIGKRWNCPVCGRPGHVSVDVEKGLFNCWHAGCDFGGNVRTLAMSLDVAEKLAPEEARALRERFAWSRRVRERAERVVRRRRWQLYEEHQALLNLYDRTGNEAWVWLREDIAWAALVFVDSRLDEVRGELSILESAPRADRARFLRLTEPGRTEVLKHVIQHGGLFDRDGRFVELGYPTLVPRTGRPRNRCEIPWEDAAQLHVPAGAQEPAWVSSSDSGPETLRIPEGRA